MERAFVIDYTKCTGCRRCELACSLYHFGECNPRLSSIRVVCKEETKENFPVGCANCSSAICMEVCPVQAIRLDATTGAVLIDGKRCIGCKTCIIYCPFGTVGFNPLTGVSFKCDLCQGNPFCIQFCPSNAIRYLPLDEILEAKNRRWVDQVIRATSDEANT